MKLEAGKYYKTRDGRKAYVACKNPFDQSDALDGFIESSGSYRWYLCGELADFWRESRDDLVKEWSEPQSGEVWVNVYENEFSTSHLDKENADHWAQANRVACIKVKFSKGQFDD